MRRVIWISCAVLFSFAFTAVRAQNTPAAAVATDNHSGSGKDIAADYPGNRAGIMIQSDEWRAVANQNPTRTKVAHGLAASLSYGLAPAKLVAEYDGEHAAVQVEAAQPVICVCHMVSIPGNPVIVRLHPKKGARELDGGKMIVYPVAGGSKMADANKTDLIPVDVSQPEAQVWLVRPQVTLEPGEYALMLGTQNISIFPFTVVQASSSPTPANAK